MSLTSETTFEIAIVDSLIESGGYTQGDAKNYSAELGMFKAEVLEFVRATLFNSVIVITDRLVLDNQLQDTIYQFEHKAGVVNKIDKDSNQLAEAITNSANIIITTLQKFPYVLIKLANCPTVTML